ncbi:MAG: alpha/beta fold hydrolase [Alphaproteobacteria bacterium]
MKNIRANMFMIHPGAGGCEVYIDLAKKISEDFDCYGIDSYNMYSKDKIDNLNKLADYYLSYIDNIMKQTNQKEYNILGWSLGGQIALEIATILESRYVKKVNLYIIDTILTDDYLESLGDEEDIKKREERFINYAVENSFSKEYLDKVLPNIEVEMNLGKQKISTALNYSKILLFKAMFEDISFSNVIVNYKEVCSYISNMKYNNIDKCIKNMSNLTLLEVHNADHSNILKQVNFLCESIISWYKNKTRAFKTDDWKD